MIIDIVNNYEIYNASATSLGAIDSLDLLYDDVFICAQFNWLKACAQRFRYALFAFIHTQTYFEYYTLTLRLASLVKKAVIYAYCTKELFDICRENVSHMATLHSVAKHVIHADNLGPRH